MPAVARIGDANADHCSPMVQAAGSGNVFCNGRGISRSGDANTPHDLPGSPCPGHDTPRGFLIGTGTNLEQNIFCKKLARTVKNTTFGNHTQTYVRAYVKH